MAKAGRRAAVVERRWIGGSCPNINCLPSKNEIWTAKVADLVHHAAKFGMVTGATAIDMAKVRQRKRDMVEGLIAMHLDLYRASGAELIMGTGRSSRPKTIEVRLNDGGTRMLTGDRVFLNLGTHATIPPIPGLADAGPLTNIELLELDRLPEHLVVLGGGYVGLEFAQAYRRFGSRVTMVEHGPQLARPRRSRTSRTKSGRFSATKESKSCSGPTCSVSRGDPARRPPRVRHRRGRADDRRQRHPGRDGTHSQHRRHRARCGRRRVGRAGLVKVNDRLETSAPDVWAIGECAGSPQFTHVSEDDFRIIRDNLPGGNRSTRDRLIPYCLFTDPPLARVGLSEGEARRRGIAVRVAKLPMIAVLRTRTLAETPAS